MMGGNGGDYNAGGSKEKIRETIKWEELYQTNTLKSKVVRLI